MNTAVKTNNSKQLEKHISCFKDCKSFIGGQKSPKELSNIKIIAYHCVKIIQIYQEKIGGEIMMQIQ